MVEFKRIAIVGSRSFDDYNFLKDNLDTIIENENIDITKITIISGGATGADKLAERYAYENKIPTVIILPKWDKYGLSAGILRNELIVQNCDLMVAFWDGQSKGTQSNFKFCDKYNKMLIIIDINGKS